MSPAPARLRGTAAGLLTAALTLAAHSVGGGALPVGASAIQLLVIAAVVGGLATRTSRNTPSRARVAWVMGALLAAGQLVGHGVLAAHGDHHGIAAEAPTWAMVAAHVGATVVGASLISAGDHLCRALSRVLRKTARHGAYPAIAPQSVARPSADQPMRAELLLASSVSHRGPPAGTSC